MLIYNRIYGFFGNVAALLSHCGTLTYRHKSPAKRQPWDQIAASQQTKSETAPAGADAIETNRFGRLIQSGHDERRTEAVPYDVLGFGVAIGLIRFVRSASIRG